SNERIAIAGFAEDKIAIFEATRQRPAAINLKSVLEIQSSELRRPHGLDFIDEHTIIVANREGNVTIFKIPTTGNGCQRLTPLKVIPSDSPGSVYVIRGDQSQCEVLICSNYSHTVTKLVLDSATCNVKNTELLLGKWLDVPDVVSVSEDGHW